MINLLPPKQKEELSLKEYFNLILIWEILIFSFLVSLALILFLVKISIEKDLEITKILLAEKERGASLNKEFQEKINAFNLRLSALNSFYQNKINLTETLEKISKNLPEKSYLVNFNLTQQLEKERGWQIALSGFSPDRKSLLLFKENLESEKSFSEIYFPPENWVKAENIDFWVNFKLK